MNMDDVLEKAREAVDVAAKKTGEVVSISKLKLEAVQVNNEIKKLYEKLGRIVYTAQAKQKPNEDAVHSLCEEIDELYDKRAALDQEIADIKNEASCPFCGYKNDKGNTYCAKCGKPLKEAASFDAEVASDDEEEEA